MPTFVNGPKLPQAPMPREISPREQLQRQLSRLYSEQYTLSEEAANNGGVNREQLQQKMDDLESQITSLKIELYLLLDNPGLAAPRWQ